MCLIVLHWQPGRDNKLTIAANRDEFYRRPARQAHFWHDSPTIFAGRDLAAGGTWLGVTQSGRFAALTNFRSAKEPRKGGSRGAICREFLAGGQTADEFCTQLRAKQDEFAGFNALLFDGHSLWYCSNRHAEFAFSLGAGTYGLSNHLLDTPWPKVERSKRQFTGILAGLNPQQDLTEAAFTELSSMLQNTTQAEDEDLPDTGIGKSGERFLSSIFIQSQDYGTRASTVMQVGRGGIRFWEQSYLESGRRGKLLRSHIPLTLTSAYSDGDRRS